MNKQNKHYNQLTQEPRYQISGLRKAGMSLRAIALEVGVHSSTISRELRRNATVDGYNPKTAHQLSDTRRKSASKANKRTDKTNKIIKESLVLGWSPDAISQRLMLETPPDEHICHTTIYKRIEEDRLQGGTLYRQLPRFGKRRWKGGKRNKKAGVKLIPDRIDISERPEVVDKRERIGDWEGDTVHGQNAHLVTLVDRSTRFTLAKRVLKKTKEAVAEAMLEMLRKVHSVKTITLDNGGEFAAHARVAKGTGAKVYFAKPYASWQRGTNENTNGRIRRFWPKKFDMATLTDKEIDDLILLLNLTPRNVLGGLTPLEAFTGRRVALIT
ncbi:IS30 family transposase [Desulfosediminicola flagellatus]|uniref:IS30 family transposase n=1 Tax=Desulfosediminicola flagellatus TaxID=2569541 RepID=UPI0010AB8192|nr:IS30 family transposase [Desulfosediminicola flagellatus]